MTQRSLESRLTRMEDNQIDLTKSIEAIMARLDKQDVILDDVKSTLSELTGAKKFLIGLTSFVAVIIGAVAGILAIVHSNK